MDKIVAGSMELDKNYHLEAMAREAAHAADLILRWQLIRIRLRRGYTLEQIAKRLGWTVNDVIMFESVNADPTLSLIRHYAHAVGALISREVIPETIAEPDEAADHA